jgi:hypothetical protein
MRRFGCKLVPIHDQNLAHLHLGHELRGNDFKLFVVIFPRPRTERLQFRIAPALRVLAQQIDEGQVVEILFGKATKLHLRRSGSLGLEPVARSAPAWLFACFAGLQVIDPVLVRHPIRCRIGSAYGQTVSADLSAVPLIVLPFQHFRDKLRSTMSLRLTHAITSRRFQAPFIVASSSMPSKRANSRHSLSIDADRLRASRQSNFAARAG